LKYYQVIDGKPYIINPDTEVTEICCGCGLAHKSIYKVTDANQIEITTYVQNK
jgi:hypothetical protein